MDFTKKIKMAEAYAQISEAELARKIGTSPQAFGQRVRTGKYKLQELERIAEEMGAEFVCVFRFPDGTEV